MNTLYSTNFKFKNQKSKYEGKVRDVYDIGDKLIIITTDRISAFDVVLPKAIPYKGQILNKIALYFLDNTKDIIDNWVIDSPDPNVIIGHKCEPFKIEMVIRGYLSGHAYRQYKNGNNIISGVEIPLGLKENDKFTYPIITPTTKALTGHDIDISKEQIIKQNIVSKSDYEKIEKYTLDLFKRGTIMAKDRGLILVDTKYEFGKIRDKIYLIDEIHTPDSSRYFYLDKYDDNQKNGKPQKQLSKEFVRDWLKSSNFMGNPGEQIPTMTNQIIDSISRRYIELYENVTGEKFKPSQENILERINRNIRRLY